MSLKVLKGKYARFSIPLPKEVKSHQNVTPQKVKEALFQILENELKDFSQYDFVDLFSGSGQIGIEALSCGFSFVYFCEINQNRRNDIRKILQSLKCPKESYQILPDGWRFLKNLDKSKNKRENPLVIFADPPYPKKNSDCEIYLKIYQQVKPTNKLSWLVMQAPKEVKSSFPLFKVFVYGSHALLLFRFENKIVDEIK